MVYGRSFVYGSPDDDYLEGLDIVRKYSPTLTYQVDYIWASWGNDTIIGGYGTNYLWGAGGNDSIHAGFTRGSGIKTEGMNFLYGGSGNDYLFGFNARSKMEGGADDDYYYIDSEDEIIEQKDAGNDTVFAHTSFYALTDHVENLYIVGGLNGSTEGRLHIGVGNDLDNRLIGGAHDNILLGLNGSDVLEGNSGNDALNGGSGADTMTGGEGDDTFLGFVFGNAIDTITDFEGAGSPGGDVIDLRYLDADALISGRQRLTFEDIIFADRSNGDTQVQVYNQVERISIRIEDGAEVSATDYAVDDFLL